LNNGFKLRISANQIGVKKKSANKMGYILRQSAGNIGAIRLEETQHHVAIAPEMLMARRLNAIPSKPKSIKSMIA
jgi:hypothetical protein